MYTHQDHLYFRALAWHVNPGFSITGQGVKLDFTRRPQSAPKDLRGIGHAFVPVPMQIADDDMFLAVCDHLDLMGDELHPGDETRQLFLLAKQGA